MTMAEYLNNLKEKGNYSFEQIAAKSGIPEGTVKNVLSGKTEDPRFDTVSKIVFAMGGSMDEFTAQKFDHTSADNTDASVEAAGIVLLRESYETRIAEIKQTYEARIKDLQKQNQSQIAHSIRIWRLCLVLISFLIGVIIVDLLFGSIGWIRY